MAEPRNQKTAAVAFAVVGVIFVATGNTAIGIVFIALAIVFAARSKKVEDER